MTPITFDWIILRGLWFALGGCVGIMLGFLAASLMAVSGSISRWEETQPEPEPQDDSAQVAALKAELEEAQANVEFYYQMATERTM